MIKNLILVRGPIFTVLIRRKKGTIHKHYKKELLRKIKSYEEYVALKRSKIMENFVTYLFLYIRLKN